MKEKSLSNEKNYNLRSRHPDFEDHFTKWRMLSKLARDSLSCEIDISYGSEQKMTLDLFPANGNDNSLLVFIHGGYWRSLDKSDHSFPALGFVPSGISVASINYALAPTVTIEKIVSQCRLAIVWLYKNAKRANAKNTKIHVCGHSAGGHLAAMMAMTDWESEGLPRNVIKSSSPISGVFDLEPIIETSINEDLQLSKSDAIKNSPLLIVPKNNTPSLVAVGLDETKAFIMQARDYASMCKKYNKQSRFLGIDNTHHFNVVTALSDASETLTTSIHKHILELT
ncbi:MAG: esterase [Rhodospirillaceae bacterium]|nr:esterase [Rhodospirillaceae bacterium]|tara:strand:+ start:11175 stop:12023 length:849 start_codon:yes stop_codon:yes gene_type:complete